MGKPEGINITELAQRTRATRKALYKKIERANKKGSGCIYVNGSGYWSLSKPGKEWLCYLIQSDWSSDKVETEIKKKICDVIDVIDTKVCDTCTEVLEDIKNAVTQG